ncbi:MAG TPA: hypothetical protein VGQ81_01470 [Acidobacteriota bacterium]|jgi:hypothetical protein|nr:hypothetical protein [Acidobacteriota bacterium]
MIPDERYEKVQRQLEFLADQQAQFFASIQAHQVEIERHTEQIGELRDFLLKSARAMDNFARQTNGQFTRVAETQMRTEERFRETDKRFRETDERFDARIKRLDVRLNVLIDVVERHFSDPDRPRSS